MKRMVFKLLWVVVIVGIVFPAGCKKTSTNLPTSQIAYMWEWTQSTGGLAGVIQTPQSEGYTQATDFDDNGQYTKYRDNAIIASGAYSLTRNVSQLDGIEYDMVVFNDGTAPQAILSVSDNQLVLREECFDCFTHTYRR
jgi:hypothetical protein